MGMVNDVLHTHNINFLVDEIVWYDVTKSDMLSLMLAYGNSLIIYDNNTE